MSAILLDAASLVGFGSLEYAWYASLLGFDPGAANQIVRNPVGDVRFDLSPLSISDIKTVFSEPR